MENRETVLLKRLSTLDQETQKEFVPDIRKWNVLGEKGYKIGFISDLWIDVAEMLVRYVEVNTEYNQLILIPIGMIAMNKKEEFVVTVDLRKSDLSKIPTHEGEVLSRDFEAQVRKSYFPNFSISGNESDFYNHNIFDERSLFGRSTREKAKKGYLESMNQDKR